MKNHLTEPQLNEYLDDELDAPGRAAVNSHLATCADCRGALAELQAVASTLAALPEEPLTRDLTASVLAKLPQPRVRLGWKLALAAQAGIGIGLSILVIANCLPLVNLPGLAAALSVSLPAIELPSFYPSSFIFHPSSFSIIFLAASALLLWGVGNAVLLRGRIRVQK
ncbi:MAG: hypothetical protein FD146_1906 [Anaerolineaceae bacterium]|nr:MAG: hypothetical protein FD146_1906 [Anaerolineaceae bacterium]